MEELKELHEQRHTEVQQKIHRQYTELGEVSVCMSDIKVSAMWVKISQIIEEKHS